MNDKYKQIIFSVVLTVVLTSIFTLAINYFQSEKLSLAYTLDGGINFEGELENLAIYNFKIINGEKSVEEVYFQAVFPGGDIRDVRINSDFINSGDGNYEGEKYSNYFSGLNPNEVVEISVLVDMGEMPNSLPKVSLRAKGVTGKLATKEESFFQKYEFWLNLVPIFLMGFVFFFSNKLFPKSLSSSSVSVSEDSNHSDDQRRILSYLSGICGLEEESERYDNLSDKISYWSESDRLTRLAIKSNKAYAKKVINLFLNLLEYASVAQISKGIIYYNMAKLEFRFWGETQDYKLYMGYAETNAKKLISSRKKIDSFWKLKK